MASESFDADVIVAGAGPVGLLTALRLAKAGISVIVLELLPEVEDSPRAAVYRGPAILELVAAGVIEDVHKKGIKTTDIAWRKADGTLIVELDSQKLFPEGHPNEVFTLGQYGLSLIMTDHLKKYPHAKVLFSHPVTGIEQDSTSVTVSSNDRKFRSKYYVGCDGGRSGSRKLLGVKMEGYTFPYPVIANNVYYDFRKYGYSNGQYIVDPKHWALIARLDDNGLYRVSYGEKEGLTTEQLEDPKRVAAKFEALFPGPRPLEYKLISTRSYMMHQRAADSFRKGRCLLAGDAARLNNPFGGLGLTGGMIDAGGVSEALVGVLLDGEPDTLLDKYAEIRKSIFLKYNNKWSIDNVKLLYETDPEKASEHPVFKAMASTSQEEGRRTFCDDHIIRHSLVREYQNPEKKAMRRKEQEEMFKGFEVKEFEREA